MYVYVYSAWIFQAQEAKWIPGREDVKSSTGKSRRAARAAHVQVAIVTVSEAWLPCFINIHLSSTLISLANGRQNCQVSQLSYTSVKLFVASRRIYRVVQKNAHSFMRRHFVTVWLFSPKCTEIN